MNDMSEIDIHKHMFVDLFTITRKQYYDRRKEAVATGDSCFIYRQHGIDMLHVKDGENFYCGVYGLTIDPAKFDGINVVKTADIYRVYIDRLPEMDVQEDVPDTVKTNEKTDDTAS